MKDIVMSFCVRAVLVLFALAIGILLGLVGHALLPLLGFPTG